VPLPQPFAVGWMETFGFPLPLFCFFPKQQGPASKRKSSLMTLTYEEVAAHLHERKMGSFDMSDHVIEVMGS